VISGEEVVWKDRRRGGRRRGSSVWESAEIGSRPQADSVHMVSTNYSQYYRW
jgi:hypothetical protein